MLSVRDSSSETPGLVCRDLVHYKGSPDPFKGDLPNQKVRDTAKEAVEAIFAPTETPSYTQPSSSLQVSGFCIFSTAALAWPANLRVELQLHSLQVLQL